MELLESLVLFVQVLDAPVQVLDAPVPVLDAPVLVPVLDDPPKILLAILDPIPHPKPLTNDSLKVDDLA
jgi:hypothetical protein